MSQAISQAATRDTAPTQAILFDAVGTLIYPDPPVAVAYADSGRRFGARLSVDEIQTRFSQAFAQQESLDQGFGAEQTSEVRERRRWQAIVAEVFCETRDTAPLLEALWDHFADPRHWRLYDDAAPALEHLAAQGFRLGLATNFDARFAAIASTWPALANCRDVFISSRMGVRKPHRDFFRTIERALQLPPESLLLVGDSLTNDFRAAQAAGWKAILLQRQGELPEIDGVIRNLGELANSLALPAD